MVARPSENLRYTHLFGSFGPADRCDIENGKVFASRQEAVDFLADQFSGERHCWGTYMGTLVIGLHGNQLVDLEEEARMAIPVRRRA